MLIVPELETVFILVPRTGTGTLYRSVREQFPRSMLLYRHMEANGCPVGYDTWRRVGFVRHPEARLRSLHTLMRHWRYGEAAVAATDAESTRIRSQGAHSFIYWLLNNDKGWTMPTCVSGTGDNWPVLSRLNPAPENRRSQFTYLRPDLGVEVFKFEDYGDVLSDMGIRLPCERKNVSDKMRADDMPLTDEAQEYLSRLCAWDYQQNCIYK